MVIVGCSSPDAGEDKALCDGCTPTADSGSLIAIVWSGDSVKQEIADQLFAQALRAVHVFGLNVEEGEEFVHSGRDLLPVPLDTSRWRAEYEGDRIWIVDTAELIYRFDEAGAMFDVIWEHSLRE